MPGVKNILLLYFQQHTSVKQFIKFCLIGVLNTLIDFGVYLLLTRVLQLHYLLSAFLAFLAAATSSYFFNKYWTFKIRQAKIANEYLKFILVAGGGLLLTLALMYLLVDIFHWYDLFSKVLTIVIVVNWNFWLQKYWTFRIRS